MPVLEPHMTDPAIDALAAPSESGACLLWPEAPAWTDLIADNRRQRAQWGATLLGRPIETWFPASRAMPVIAVGHQPAFFHPGVWAKNVAASELAVRLGGRAVLFAVDGDAPGSFGLRWPEPRGDFVEEQKANAPDWRVGLAYEQTHAGTAEAWQDVFTRAASAACRWQGDGLLKRFADAFTRLVARDAVVVDRWVEGMKALDAALGVRSPETVRIGHAYSNARHPLHAAAMAMVAHLLESAEAFARCYNDALAAYRSQRGIAGHQHPIPDLMIDGDRVELPFWVFRGMAPRQRLTIEPTGRDGIALYADSEFVGSVAPGAMRASPAEDLAAALGSWAIRPRALAQTMFIRMMACDLFIHGIGGAKYDQITDELIRRYWAIEPPRFTCASATLRLPIRQFDVRESDLERLRHRRRDVRFNPQRYLTNDETTPDVRRLLDERRQAIGASERLRETAPQDRAARAEAFRHIRALNAQVLAAANGKAARIAEQVREVEARLAHNAVAADREWFVGLHPEAALAALRDRVRASLP